MNQGQTIQMKNPFSQPGQNTRPNIARGDEFSHAVKQFTDYDPAGPTDNDMLQIGGSMSSIKDEDQRKPTEYNEHQLALLGPELERLNAINEQLIKENDQTKAMLIEASNREADFENKLKLILAENDRLNRVLQEFLAQRGPGSQKYQDMQKEIQKWRQQCHEISPQLETSKR
jgi:hypothetical protein